MELDLQGWHSNRPIFQRLLTSVQPRRVFELGSWKGASVIHMAQLSRVLKIPTAFYAVDFWSEEVVIEGGTCPFEQFLFNLRATGVDDIVMPVRMQTSDAAKEFHARQLTAQLIYVDADHTYEGALADMENFYPLLDRGGVMFGDDVTEIPTVRQAVEEFCRRHDLYYRADYYHWELSPKL